MADDLERDYYQARETVSRELAGKALNPDIGKIHRDRAEVYAAKARSTEPARPARAG